MSYDHYDINEPIQLRKLNYTTLSNLYRRSGLSFLIWQLQQVQTVLFVSHSPLLKQLCTGVPSVRKPIVLTA
ncbi:Hypothetical predicted protein [Mytilus galloprovincialis]|uniref:Uncharacterized protein n=1 Tax=Mytilus galloprovincialis TaxID=29158 RepID=A0A8B6EWB5_MYTGA|nr:Hypothetical predicted protein [Mytilus galloprovincialis]